jgi:hypothetical protein
MFKANYLFQLVQCAQKITRYVCITDFFLESAGELRIKYIKKGKKEVQNGPVTRKPPYGGQNLEYRKKHTHAHSK